MAREISIPSPATYIQDFGLNVSPEPAQRNKRVVIIGTSEDGPMYEPIQVNKPEDAEFVWGRSNVGDLVRGIRECWDVQGVFLQEQYSFRTESNSSLFLNLFHQPL